MSTHEYNELFLKCHRYAPYHIYTFDIKNSKKMLSTSRKLAQIKLLKFITLMYNKIYIKSIKENKNILVFNETYGHLGESSNGFGMKVEPFILGDLVGFTVYRDSITKDEVMQIYNECIKEVDIDFEFHSSDGYYETDDWCKARDKYFRGHCIDLLSNLHKPYNANIRKKLKQIEQKML